MKENKILFNSIHGVFVPKFYWKNYNEMDYYYDELNNSLICENISIKLNSENITKSEMRLYIDLLMETIKIEYKLIYNIELEGYED